MRHFKIVKDFLSTPTVKQILRLAIIFLSSFTFLITAFLGKPRRVPTPCNGTADANATIQDGDFQPPPRIDYVLASLSGVVFVACFAIREALGGASFKISCRARPGLCIATCWLTYFTISLYAVYATYLSYRIFAQHILLVAAECILLVLVFVYRRRDVARFDRHCYEDDKPCCRTYRDATRCSDTVPVLTFLLIGFLLLMNVTYCLSLSMSHQAPLFESVCKPVGHIEYCLSHRNGTADVKCSTDRSMWFGMDSSLPNLMAAIVGFFCSVTLMHQAYRTSSEVTAPFLKWIAASLSLCLFFAFGSLTAFVYRIANPTDVTTGLALGVLFGAFSIHFALRQLGESRSVEVYDAAIPFMELRNPTGSVDFLYTRMKPPHKAEHITLF